jgi:hypothetical protein
LKVVLNAAFLCTASVGLDLGLGVRVGVG